MARRLSGRFVAALAGALLVLVPLGFVVASSTSIGQRIVDHLYVDNSAEVRNTQWEALNYLTPRDVLLGTPQDTPQHWLAAGEALAHLLLRAQVDGVSASYLNQPIEVPELRPRLQLVAGRPGFPQMLLRLGVGREAAETPRRPVSDVLAG